MRTSIVSLAILLCASVAHADRSSARVAVIVPWGVNPAYGNHREVAHLERAELDSWVRGARGFGAAKQHIVVPLPPGAQIQVLQPGRYDPEKHIDQPAHLKLIGFRGDVPAIHLGTMSVHDLGTGSSYNQAEFDRRARTDTLALELDGKRVLNRATSGVVAMHDIVIPHGTQEIHYIRQDAGGSEHGRNGYVMGRVLKLSWDQ